MTTKSYSKHKEFKEFSSKGNIPYTDEQFDMLKSELIPKGSKLDALSHNDGHREYHYEYKEEKHPSGKYDRKDLHTVEEYTIPPKSKPKSAESSSYYYTREEKELPAISSGARTYNYESSTSATPGYSKVKNSKVTKDLSHNVEELDSLLDDLQKDQERQLYKSGYTSDTAESTSFDYKRGTALKAPSSGYSTLKREERLESSSWGSPPPPPPAVARQELRQEMYREEKTESRVVPSQVSPAIPHQVPPVVCGNCHHSSNLSATSTLSRSATPMNKVTTTVKTYTYEVPAGSDPTTVPLPAVADSERTYLSRHENLLSTSNTTSGVSPAPPSGCQYCSHCSTSMHYNKTTMSDEHTSERVIYPTTVNEVKSHPIEPLNGTGPYGPTSYKFSETTYSATNTRERLPAASPPPAASPFRPHSPPAGTQQPPKRLDDLLAEFPEARFPTETDGVHQRKVEVRHETSSSTPRPAPPPSRNVSGPAVYYPPGHTPFQKKEGYQAASMQSGGAYASGRGMYEYESGARSKEKHSEKKTAVPICLPLCCAMPCVIM